jgi:hypothetical protein
MSTTIRNCKQVCVCLPGLNEQDAPEYEKTEDDGSWDDILPNVLIVDTSTDEEAPAKGAKAHAKAKRKSTATKKTAEKVPTAKACTNYYQWWNDVRN